MEDLVDVIKLRYKIDDDAAKELARVGDFLIRKGFEHHLDEQMKDSFDCSDALMTAPLIMNNIAPFAEHLKSMPPNITPWVIHVAGNGDCLFTSLRGSQDKEESVRYALMMLEKGLNEYDVMVEPNFNCQDKSENHEEGKTIRSLTTKWLHRLDMELPESFGKITNGNEQRPMTRGDLVLLETQFSSKKSISMDASTKEERDSICQKYLQSMVDGQWASTPHLVAFSFMRKPTKTPIRVYQVLDGKLQKYIDIEPDGCDPLPPVENDEILEPVRVRCAATFPDASDIDEWIHEKSDDFKSDDSQSDDSDDDPECAEIFTRLLYSSPGHYDILVTDFERSVLTHVWPRTAQYMHCLQL